MLLITEFKLFIESSVSRLVLLQNNNNNDTLKMLIDILREYSNKNFLLVNFNYFSKMAY